MTVMFVNGSKRNEQFPQRTFHRCFLPRFGPFGQTVSEQKIFRNRPIRNKNCLWWPCLLMDREKMNKLQRTFHRCFLPSFSSFGKVVSEDKIFRNQPIRNKNCLWQPYLLMDQDKNEHSLQRTSHRYILPRFGSFGKAVSEEKIFQKSTNQKQELSLAAMFVNESGQNEQS